MPRTRVSLSATERRRSPVVAIGVAALVVPTWLATASPILAHENEVIRFGSFLGGMTHPVLGPDHLLAMLCVGILSSQIGGRAILTVPATFVVAMAAGGAVGVATGALPMGLVELGIGASVLLLGGIIAAARRIPTRAAMAAVAVFGFFHGYAHGVEIPSIADAALYALGFVTGTALIHVAGVLIGEVSRQYAAGSGAIRVAGASIALIGALFILGIA
jgi:urease accessory protein